MAVPGNKLSPEAQIAELTRKLAEEEQKRALFDEEIVFKDKEIEKLKQENQRLSNIVGELKNDSNSAQNSNHTNIIYPDVKLIDLDDKQNGSINGNYYGINKAPQIASRNLDEKPRQTPPLQPPPSINSYGGTVSKFDNHNIHHTQFPVLPTPAKNAVLNIDTTQMVTRTALGFESEIGKLYNIHQDKFFNTKIFKESPEVVHQHREDLSAEVFDEHVINEKYDGYGIEDELKVNLISRFTDSELFLANKNDTNIVVSLLLVKYRQEVYINNNYSALKVIKEKVKEASHFVHGIIYGYRITVELTWAKNLADEIAKQNAILMLQAELEFIKRGIFQDPNNSENKRYNKDFNAIIKVNNFPQHYNLQSQRDIVIQVQTLLGQHLDSVPLKYKLCPLSDIHIGKPFYEAKTYNNLDRNIILQVINTVDAMNRLYFDYNDFVDRCRVISTNLPQAFMSRLQKDVKELKETRVESISKLKSLIGKYRNGCLNVQEIETFLKRLHEILKQWDLHQQYQDYDYVKYKIKFIEELKAKNVVIIGRTKESPNELIDPYLSTNIELVVYYGSIQALISKVPDELQANCLFNYIKRERNAKQIFYDSDINNQVFHEKISMFREKRQLFRMECENLLKRDSLATSPNIEQIPNQPKTHVHLKVSCPNSIEGGASKACSKEEIYWSCKKCREKFTYAMDNYFYCNCGRALANTFSFHCGNWQHGTEFVTFPADKLYDRLKSLSTEKRLTLLVIGDTGVGKSTWINGFANYVTFNSLNEAKESDLLYVIPVQFTIYDDEYNEILIQIGKSENEGRLEGRSKTQKPREHTFHHDGMQICFIDTPGVNDCRGDEQDKKNFDYIINFISEYPQINAICILIKANLKSNKFDSTYKYCISTLLSHLNQSAVENIVFIFTHTKASNYAPGDSLPALRSYIQGLRFDQPIDLSVDRIFNVDNEAFRYLCAKQKGIDLAQNPLSKSSFEESWKRSKEEVDRLLDKVHNLKPYIMRDMSKINEARKDIFSLVRPMVDICANIQVNINILRQRHDQVANTSHWNLGQLKKSIPWVKIEVGEVPLIKDKDGRVVGNIFTKTVCTNKGCAQIKTKRIGNSNVKYVKYHICHQPCSVQNLTFSSFGHPELESCNEMDSDGNCTKCSKCHWSSHMNFSYNNTIKIVQESTKETLEMMDTSIFGASNADEKKNLLSIIENKIVEFEAEWNKLLWIMAKFGSYVKSTSLLKDPYIVYLNHMADLELFYENGKEEEGNLVYPILSDMLTKINVQDHEKVRTNEEIKHQKHELLGMNYAGPYLRQALKIIINENKKARAMAEEHFHVQK